MRTRDVVIICLTALLATAGICFVAFLKINGDYDIERARVTHEILRDAPNIIQRPSVEVPRERPL